VRFRAGPRTHRHELLITSPRADFYMETLPGTSRVGREAVVAPAEPRVAVALAKVLEHDDRDAVVASAVRDWLRVATRWMGRVTATEINDRPTWVVIGNGAPLPSAVRERLGDVPESGTWRLALDADGRDLLLALREAEPLTKLDEQAQRCLSWVEQHPGVDPPAALVTMRKGENGELEFGIDELWGHGLADRFAGLPGARDTRGAPDGHVAVVADAWAPDAVQAFVSEWAVALDDEARGVLDGLLEEHREAEDLVKLSLATSGEVEVPGLQGELMPFQAAGIHYALARRRAFIADEQGLGKTVQALATVELAGAFPAVIACPASLKLNWEREAARWLPHRKVAIVSGKRAVDTGDADFIVINYDILDAHRERLAKQSPGALILDESHYCKNPSAQRTKATLELAKSLPNDALRLALTGTPLVNRPKELVPQLRILGRLREFGSGSELERRFGATSERERLHWHLRRTCYVRRLKKDVLPQLPAKRRAIVPFDIDNDKEYRQAERNLVEWLAERFGTSGEFESRLDGAMRAEALVRVNALRQLVAAGKLSSAIGWIEDFLASGEKLVVFAAHRAIQQGLVDKFPGQPHILGSDTLQERDAAVQRFQTSPEARLCICSLKVAAHGFTLTAAANAAFLELGWTPAEHDQAEDRCHRIGQTDSVTAWYLLAADTIDERMAALIDAKREVVAAVADGRPATESAMIDGLLADYMRRS
jgi:superfamily II DNA or RNA helicase